MANDGEAIPATALAKDGVLPALAYLNPSHYFFSRVQEVFYISEERFVWGSKSKKRILQDNATDSDDTYSRTLSNLGKKRGDTLLSDIVKVEVGDKGEYGRVWNWNFCVAHLLRVQTRNETREWVVPSDVAEIVSRAFSTACPGRFERVVQVMPASSLHVNNGLKVFLWSWLVLALLIIGSLPLAMYIDDLPSNLQAVLGPLLIVLSVASGFVSLTLVVLFFSLIVQLVKSIFIRRRHRSPKAKSDLSARQPLAIPAVGALLRFVGGILFSISYFGYWPPGILIAAIIVFFGYRLSLGSAEKRLKKDPRTPILYLRAFEDDGRSSYNPAGWAAYWLGLRARNFLWNANPLRVVRMIFNCARDTSEEQMAGFLNKFGPLVAIGRPGERIRLGGAARIYVPDDSWKQTVHNFMNNAQFVLLQPAETSGVWWEVEQMLERVPCERVLLTLVNFIDQPNRYTLFRWRFEQMTRRQLPRSLGNALFCCFTDGWQPQMMHRRYHTPFLWPLMGCALNFPKTLKPFLARLNGKEPSAFLPSESESFAWLSRLFAVILWTLLSLILALLQFIFIHLADSSAN